MGNKKIIGIIGYTEDELFERFSNKATYVGGGCYTINFINRELYATDTLELMEKYKACFQKRGGLYYHL